MIKVILYLILIQNLIKNVYKHMLPGRDTNEIQEIYLDENVYQRLYKSQYNCS